MSRKRGRSDTPPKPDGWMSYFPPREAPIDVVRSDLSQGDAKLEWWYFNAHLRSASDGRELSAFASFFRQRIEGRPVSSASMFALSDLGSERYLCDTVFDPTAYSKVELMLTPEALGRPLTDVERAVLDWVKQKRLPHPARVIEHAGAVTVHDGKLRFDMGDHVLTVVDREGPAPPGVPPIAYRLTMRTPEGHAIDLTLTPQVPPVLHGDTGVVNMLYYYYIPRCSVTGTVTIDGRTEVVAGEGWYDREFGGTVDHQSANALDAWVWFSLQLDDDSEYSLFSIQDSRTGERKDHVSVYTRRGAERVVTHEAVVTDARPWTSMATLMTFPQSWTITDPTIGADFRIESAFPHQEMPTILVEGGAFFEGRVNVAGTLRGKPVLGRGYLEYKQRITEVSTEHSLKRLSALVKETLQSKYSDDVGDEWIRENVAGRNYVPGGTPPARIAEALFRPVRQLIDRGGKSWRSLLLSTAISALKKEYLDCTRFIIVPELLHVGSLIIDDIQDDSVVRRGGRCVHLDVGVPLAINAGTATYFMALQLAEFDKLSPEQELRLYRLYFDCMRAGHAGQGLDILGLHYLFPEAVATGNVDKILRHLQAIHVYKTGGAASNVMMTGGVIANATEEQVEAYGQLGKSIGLAFQIVDDALNLRGFDGDLKEVGEDIRDGKITYPILKAFPKLSKEQREYVDGVLREHTSDPAKIRSVITLLDGVGAIDDCMDEARTLVNEAWERVDSVIHDSIPKLLMRTFLTFLVDRQR